MANILIGADNYSYMHTCFNQSVFRRKAEIIALMKDHSKSQAKIKADYPKQPVRKITFTFTEKDFAEIESWLHQRFEQISKAEKLPDDELPLCTPEERFNNGDKFAVMRKGRKTALRVLDSMEDAKYWMAANGGDYIETRKGEDKKCMDYCSACEFCNYYKEVVVMDNLAIYNATRKPPQNALKTIKGGRLSGYTDINPMWRIKALTEQFGPCGIGWKYIVTRQWLEEGANGEIAAFCNIDLYFKYNNEWSEAIPGTGGSTFVAKEKTGLYTSDECFKMALTDAISVACKSLGMAADIYWESDKPRKQQKYDTKNN